MTGHAIDLDNSERKFCFLHHSNGKITMLPRWEICLISAILLTGCAKGGDEIDRANALMRIGVASDVSIDIEPRSEKSFTDATSGRHYICGRAVVNQPKLADHLVQRFIITTDKEIERGLARFESGSADEKDAEFVQNWDAHCPGHALPPRVNATPAAASTEARTVNFDPVTNHVSDSMLADPWKVFEAVRALPLSRGEFEKATEYQARLKSAGSTKLYGDLQLSGPLAFEVEHPALRYDADKETLHYDEYVSGLSRIKLAERRVTDLTTRYSGDLTVESMARMYREREFKEVRFAEHAVLAPTNVNGASIVVDLKLPPAKAAALKDKVRVVYVGRLAQPYYSDEVDPIDERYHPNDIYLLRMLDFKVEGVWLVDRNSGEVLSRKFKIRKAE